MKDSSTVGEFEVMVLLAVLHIGKEAYPVPVRREIEDRTGRKVSRGAIYVTLDRLEAKGLVESWLDDPSPDRGGKPNRYYKVEPAGRKALRESARAMRKMWAGLETKLGEL